MSSHENPGAPRRAQELPGEASNSQESPEAPRRAQELPGTPRTAQELPGGEFPLSLFLSRSLSLLFLFHCLSFFSLTSLSV